MLSVAQWLQRQRSEAVSRIVQRLCAELPEYRRRPVGHLTLAAGVAYDQWCTTVLENNLMRHAREAEAVITQSIAQGNDPDQLARVPALICAEVLALLDTAGPEVDPGEVALFRDRAQRMTTSILAIGGLVIARLVLKRAVEKPRVAAGG
jgi:hypothetical protein